MDKKILQIQTKSPFDYIISDKIFSLTSPGNNISGPEITIASLTFPLTNYNNPISFTGFLPIQIQPITLQANQNINLTINVYNSFNPKSPAYSNQLYLVDTYFSPVAPMPLGNYVVVFNFSDNLSRYHHIYKPPTYRFTVQLNSSIPITNEITLNYKDKNNPNNLGSYFNIIAQQGSI